MSPAEARKATETAAFTATRATATEAAALTATPATATAAHRRMLDAITPLLVIAALLALWELAAAAGWLRPILFPPPSKLARSFVELIVDGFPEGVTLGSHFAITIQRILIGYVGALALAIPLGLVIGWFPTLDRMTEMVIAFARSVATLSLLPVALVWFGTGETTKIFLIGYGCFWVMLSNVVAAVKLVDPLLLRAARTMDTRRSDLFLRVALPAALPRIFSGARIALGVGFMVIVGAEMIDTIKGLGALIMEARTFYRSDITMVGMFVLGVLGFAIAVGLQRLEVRLMPWEQRDGGRNGA